MRGLDSILLLIHLVHLELRFPDIFAPGSDMGITNAEMRDDLLYEVGAGLGVSPAVLLAETQKQVRIKFNLPEPDQASTPA